MAEADAGSGGATFDRVFVTGGSGFVGGALTGRLVSEGHQVVALARSEEAAASVRARGATVVRGDLDSVDAMSSGMEGATLVVHCAAKASASGRLAGFQRANVEGTKNVLEAARKAGVRRFVHVGTEAATMVGDPLVNIDETYPLAPESKAPYSSTKALAEQAVISSNGKGGLETVVVRPRFIWGRGDTNLLPELVVAAQDGKLVWIDGGRHLTSTTHIDNVIEGILLAAEEGQRGEAYFVTDGDPVEFREFVTRLLATQGVEAPTREVPRWLARSMMGAGETLWGALPLPGSPPLTRLEFWLISTECTIDDSKARNELGYKPVVTIEEGLSGLETQQG